jgi:hypothetical protein
MFTPLTGCTPWLICFKAASMVGGRDNVYAKLCLRAIGMLMLFLGPVVVNAADLRWDGEANDGLWQNPLNWSSNTLPGSNDDLIFDNTNIPGSYMVTLGPGAGPVNIRSLHISPSASNTITVIVPQSNVETPALACSGTVFGLVLEAGAIFINESGASAGTTMEIADSIRINNGGRYIHRTPRSHAETVRSLSRSPGTERGEFEFNIPVASSTISLSGQVFGKLRLSPGRGGTINYTGTGTNSLTIRSDLEIMPGVNLSLNLEGKLLIGGDLLHNGGIFNLGSTARHLVLELEGHFRQSASAITTESGTAQPEIVLHGNTVQELEIKGSVNNEVSFRINNPAGVILHHDLSVAYKLKLENGVLTTNEYMVTLQPACQLEVGPETNGCFVNGKIEKKGLINASFYFPVGKSGTRRWVKLHEATGDFIIEYIRSDPRTISSIFGAGISHISSLEYWTIQSNGVNPNAIVELAFDLINSGAITDLGNLRVAQLNGQSWIDAGNSATTGTAGSSGSVSSMMQTWTGSLPRLYVLASSAANQNPLPISWKNVGVFVVRDMIRLEWSSGGENVAYYKVEKSADGLSFVLRDIVPSKVGSAIYQYTEKVEGMIPFFYRVVMMKHDSSQATSKVMKIDPGLGSSATPRAGAQSATVFLSKSILKLGFLEPRDLSCVVTIFDISGRLLFKARVQINSSSILLPVKLYALRGQNLFINLREDNGNNFTLKTVVQE